MSTPAIVVQHGTAPDRTPAKHRPWRGILHVVLWPLRPLLDKSGNPSTTKFVILALLYLAHNKTPLDAVTSVAVLAASFGYSAWKDYQSRFTATASTVANFALHRSEAHSTHEETRRTITEQVQARRDVGDGIEATP